MSLRWTAWQPYRLSHIAQKGGHGHGDSQRSSNTRKAYTNGSIQCQYFLYQLLWTTYGPQKIQKSSKAFCINLLYSPKDKSLKCLRKKWKLGELKISGFFESVILIFFSSSPWKSVNIYRVVRMGWNSDDYPDFQPKTTPAERYATQCIYQLPCRLRQQSCAQCIFKEDIGKSCFF